jgi:hypothetical protein
VLTDAPHWLLLIKPFGRFAHAATNSNPHIADYSHLCIVIFNIATKTEVIEYVEFWTSLSRAHDEIVDPIFSLLKEAHLRRSYPSRCISISIRTGTLAGARGEEAVKRHANEAGVDSNSQVYLRV